MLTVCVVVCAGAGGVAGDGSARGGEISSANYVARKFGVRAGTFVRTAKQRCPDLVVLPYDFVRIKQVSETVYRMFCRVSGAWRCHLCCGARLESRTRVYGITLCNVNLFHWLLAQLHPADVERSRHYS